MWSSQRSVNWTSGRDWRKQTHNNSSTLRSFHSRFMTADQPRRQYNWTSIFISGTLTNVITKHTIGCHHQSRTVCTVGLCDQYCYNAHEPYATIPYAGTVESVTILNTLFVYIVADWGCGMYVSVPLARAFDDRRPTQGGAKNGSTVFYGC